MSDPWPLDEPVFLLHCRANVPAKPYTPSTQTTCRISALAAHRLAQSPCGCPCTAPMAPPSTTRSSMPWSASAPPGSVSSEACCLPPGGSVPPQPGFCLVPLTCSALSQALLNLSIKTELFCKSSVVVYVCVWALSPDTGLRDVQDPSEHAPHPRVSAVRC